VETRDVVSIMAAVIFAARPDGKDAHQSAVDHAAKLLRAVAIVKSSDLIRQG
jgi:hypothetical protein